MTIRRIKTSKVNYDISSYIGRSDEIYYGTDGILRYGDGVTSGGFPFVSTKDENFGGSLTVSEVDINNQTLVSVSDVRSIKFDKETGFSVEDLGDGEVKISLGSTFKTWKVDGQDDLVAVGEDIIRIIPGPGITITTDASVPKGQTITFSGFSGDYEDLTNTPNLEVYATTNYVDTAVSSLVDTAPETLDTLNELASALGDDPNFATTISTLIGSKANTADLATVATSGRYNDLINKPVIPTNTNQLINGSGYITSTALTNYATQAFVTSRGYLTSVSYDIITNKPDFSTVATTGSYTDLLDLPQLFDGNYNDLYNLPTLFSGSYNDLTDKPVLFSGDYNDLFNAPTLFSGSYTDLTNKPTIPSDVSDLTDTSNLLDHFSGNYDDLTNKPSIPQNLNDLNDVDTVTNPPQFGQVLKYDGEKWGPASDIGSADGGGGTVTDASTLNGFNGSYYLNYNNLNNKPAPYELPPATAETLGGVKIGENINVNNGTISVPKGAGINKVVDIPDVYDDNGLENKYILRYNSGATRWETEDLNLSNSTMDGGFY
jgi:hypothetical protein